jgi:hypothetical protein
MSKRILLQHCTATHNASTAAASAYCCRAHEYAAVTSQTPTVYTLSTVTLTAVTLACVTDTRRGEHRNTYAELTLTSFIHAAPAASAQHEV